MLMSEVAAIYMPFLGSLARFLRRFAHHVAVQSLGRDAKKKKVVMADSFDEFVVKGELNSISLFLNMCDFIKYRKLIVLFNIHMSS